MNVPWNLTQQVTVLRKKRAYSPSLRVKELGVMEGALRLLSERNTGE